MYNSIIFIFICIFILFCLLWDNKTITINNTCLNSCGDACEHKDINGNSLYIEPQLYYVTAFSYRCGNKIYELYGDIKESNIFWKLKEFNVNEPNYKKIRIQFAGETNGQWFIRLYDENMNKLGYADRSGGLGTLKIVSIDHAEHWGIDSGINFSFNCVSNTKWSIDYLCKNLTAATEADWAEDHAKIQLTPI